MTLTAPSRRWALGLLAAAIAVPAGAQSNTTGIYRVEGRNPDGSAYTGSVRVSQSGGNVSLDWTVGARTYAGRGTFDGRLMVVDWGDRYPVVYVLMADGTLHGTWANGRALEKLTP